ncbi:hypothetical protein RvVAT039_12710 [Agrobacterium vitis]|nr:hypothetical protein RvVAT039_12710 [Agrobacterium vitis]
MRNFSLLLSFIFLTPSFAFAAEIELGASGEKYVLVWRSQSDRDDGKKLLESGIKESDLLLPLLRCIPENGEKAVILSGKQFSTTKEIIVTSGTWKGCRGIVDAYDVPIDSR